MYNFKEKESRTGKLFLGYVNNPVPRVDPWYKQWYAQYIIWPVVVGVILVVVSLVVR